MRVTGPAKVSRRFNTAVILKTIHGESVNSESTTEAFIQYQMTLKFRFLIKNALLKPCKH